MDDGVEDDFDLSCTTGAVAHRVAVSQRLQSRSCDIASEYEVDAEWLAVIGGQAADAALASVPRERVSLISNVLRFSSACQTQATQTSSPTRQHGFRNVRPIGTALP